MKVDSAGNAIVVDSSPGSGGNLDFYTAKYAAANGALLWERRYNGTGNGADWADAVDVDSAGNPVVFGLSLGSSGNDDFYTAKYAAANGALLWERRDGPVSASISIRTPSKRLALTPDGGAVVTGFTYNGTNNSSDYYTVKYVPVDLDLDDGSH